MHKKIGFVLLALLFTVGGVAAMTVYVTPGGHKLTPDEIHQLGLDQANEKAPQLPHWAPDETACHFGIWEKNWQGKDVCVRRRGGCIPKNSPQASSVPASRLCQ